MLSHKFRLGCGRKQQRAARLMGQVIYALPKSWTHPAHQPQHFPQNHLEV